MLGNQGKNIISPIENWEYLCKLQHYMIQEKYLYQKKYYLKNISNIKPIDETFTTTKELDKLLDNSISIWFQKDVEPFDVKLYIDQIVSKYFQRKPISKTQTIESINSDGSIEINIKATSEMEILPIVKYWLPHIKVLEPKWIDDIVKKDLEKYLKKFI